MQYNFIALSLAPEVAVFIGLGKKANSAKKDKIILDFEFQNGLNTAFIDNIHKSNSLY